MKRILAVLLFLISTEIFSVPAKIQDVAKISTQRENYLVGYGLVIGLPQTGDSKLSLTKETLENMLNYTGIEAQLGKYQGKNVAAVMVMARLPMVSGPGQQIDIWISSIGDAKSLNGGYLIQTPLQGQDGQVYAVAQSNINVIKTEKQIIRSDNSTTVFVSKGAIIEKGVEQPLIVDNDKVRLILRSFDIVNLNNVRKAIEKKYPDSTRVNAAGIIEVTIPKDSQKIDFISSIMTLPVDIKSENKVVIDSQSGTIVMGEDVKISRFGLTKKGITIKVQGAGPESRKEVSSSLIEEATSVEDLVKGLNTLGLSADEIIDILKTIDAAGALHGDLIIL